jgi:signal peptidase
MSAGACVTSLAGRGREQKPASEARQLLHAVGVGASWALLALVVAGAVALLVVPKLTGSVPLTVLSGSMSPTYEPGSVVIVRPTPADELQIGDAITYQIRPDDPTVVTHRIVGVTIDGRGDRGFVTQGDANNAPDAEPVIAAQVKGRVWYSVPYVGYASSWLTGTRREVVTAIAAGALLAYGAFTIVSGLVQRRRPKQVAAS